MDTITEFVHLYPLYQKDEETYIRLNVVEAERDTAIAELAELKLSIGKKTVMADYQDLKRDYLHTKTNVKKINLIISFKRKKEYY